VNGRPRWFTGRSRRCADDRSRAGIEGGAEQAVQRQDGQLRRGQDVVDVLGCFGRSGEEARLEPHGSNDGLGTLECARRRPRPPREAGRRARCRGRGYGPSRPRLRRCAFRAGPSPRAEISWRGWRSRGLAATARPRRDGTSGPGCRRSCFLDASLRRARAARGAGRRDRAS
jgi:hypothetical protein